MNFRKRLTYYLLGAIIGGIIVVFIFGDKKISCAYFPNARVLKNITEKEIVLNKESLDWMQKNQVDSANFKDFILKRGTVDFKKSNTELDSCKVYYIDFKFKEQSPKIHIENCEKKARIISFENN